MRAKCVRLRALRRLGLGKPRAVGRWSEITTVTDSVGRIALPRLEHAESHIVAGVGNPLLDHVSYFHPAGPATWHLACETFPAAMLRQPQAVLALWERYAQDTIARIRAFTCATGLVLLGSYAIGRLDDDVKGMAAITAQARSPAWLFLGLLLLTFTAGATAHDPIAYGRLTPTEHLLLPIAPRLCQAGVVAVACALPAGYRPRLVPLMAIIAALGILAAYLPGDNGFFMAWTVVVTLVLCLHSVVTRRYRVEEPAHVDGRLGRVPITRSYRLFERAPTRVAARRGALVLLVEGGLWRAGVINGTVCLSAWLWFVALFWITARRKQPT